MTPTLETRQATDATVQLVWKMIGTHLENARRRTQEEITHYPPPIPACDAHFNYLLEQRARIGEESNRMRLAERKSISSTNPISLIEEFILSSNYVDDEMKRQICSRLNELRM